MNDILDNNFFDNSPDDIKLRYFLDRCLPMDVDTDDIKLKTHQKIRRQRHYRRLLLNVVISVAACALLIIAFGLPLWQRTERKVKEQTVTAVSSSRHQTPYETLTVPTGKTQMLLLADGTRIMANSRTTIHYPKAFVGTCREISIDGEAYLEVAHDSRHPFIVHGDGFSLRVIGTRFNFSSYRGKRAEVALVEGSVEIKSHGEVVRMRPDNLVRIEDGTVSELLHVRAADYLSWTKGYINLSGQKVGDIIPVLESYYGIHVICSSNIAGERLYGKLMLGGDYKDALQHILFLTDGAASRNGGIIKLYKR
jgi:transmembrane sensor